MSVNRIASQLPPAVAAPTESAPPGRQDVSASPSMASWQPLLLTSPLTLSHPLQRSHPDVGHDVEAEDQPAFAGSEIGVEHAVSLKNFISPIAGRQVTVAALLTL